MCQLFIYKHQNAYSGKFSNVNNEFNVTMLETKNFL